MSAQQHTADDAVYALRAVARLLLAAPNSNMPPEWARTHAAYFQDMAEAVIGEAKLDRSRIDTGADYVGHDWESALIPILFPDDQIEHVANRVREV